MVKCKLYIHDSTQEITKFNFLEEEKFEEILYMKEENLGVSIPWYQNVIINFWDVPQEQYHHFDFCQGIEYLFNSQIKCLKEVQFKFFNRIPDERLETLIKLKINGIFYHFEIMRENSFQLQLNWSEQLPFLDKIIQNQLVMRKINNILSQMSDNSYVFNQLKLSEYILENQYESIFLYYPSNIKLRINNVLVEDPYLKVEIFLHEEWFSYPKPDLQQNFDILYTQLSNYIKISKQQCNFDIALIVNESQVQNHMIMTFMNQLMIQILFQNNQYIQYVQLSLMPYEIHFDYQVKSQILDLNINLHHQDPEDMYQDGLLIFLQPIINCKLVKQLHIDIECDEESQNKTFQLFTFLMNINDYFQSLESGTFIYNSIQLIPKHQSITGKGKFHFLVSDHKAMYLIRQEQYLDQQKEIISFIQYNTIFGNSTITQMILSCDLLELDRSSQNFFTDLINAVVGMNSITEFGMLDIHNRSHIKNNRIDVTLIFLIKHFKQKRKVITAIKILNQFKYRKQILDEIRSYLPEEYDCLKYF